MKRFGRVIVGVATLGVTATSATAQATLNVDWASGQQEQTLSPSARTPVASINPATTASLNRQTYVVNTPPEGREFGPVIDFQSDYPTDRFSSAAERSSPFAATSRSDIWREGDGYTDRLRLTTRGDLRRADGVPVPATLQDESDFNADSYDVTYTRGFTGARGYTASGLEVSLTPHAGVGVGDQGGLAEAGATLKIGSGIARLVPRGSREFGERSRWYVYAASSGRAVGYNFARNRDGDFLRSGVSQDRGTFLGDASIGVAMRRGDMQTSFGVVYREIKAKGMRGGDGIDRDVSEGLVAFQFSIRPER